MCSCIKKRNNHNIRFVAIKKLKTGPKRNMPKND